MRYCLLAIISGILITLSLAPFHFWPLAIVAAALLFFLLEKKTPKASFVLGWCFGAGLFGSGSSWVYVSIHDFGYTSAPLAILLTFLFCGGLALCTAATCAVYAKLINSGGKPHQQHSTAVRILMFAAIWTLGEWMRSWLLSGFPWLFIGYSHVDALLASWAPIIGVYGISFIIVASGASLAVLVHGLYLHTKKTNRPISQRISAVVTFFLIGSTWLAPLALKQMQWTTPYGKAMKVSFVQANISQHDKWKPDQLTPSLNLYTNMTQQAFENNSDLIIWPEAAIPTYYQYAHRFLDNIEAKANQSNAAIITGIPTRDTYSDKVYNSVIALGKGSGLYHKQRLVPFGEYVPFATLLGNLMAFFELPVSTMQAGNANQPPLAIDDWESQPLVCYEIVYPTLSAQAARVSDVIITISNDSWFGASLGPLQHLQMAQMRALETGRYVLRGTGNGVSAIINNHGEIIQRSEQFKRQLLHGEFYLTANNTPWVTAGYWLIPYGLLFAVGITALTKKP